MRLPWPSRRATGRSTGGAAAAPAAAGDGTQSSALPVGRSEWRDVGTLHPSFQADPGIRVHRFRDQLAGSHLPAPILRPLGHQRSAEGPAGLVSGLTHPVIARVTAGPGGMASLPLAHRRARLTADAAVPMGADAADVAAVSTDAAALPTVQPRHAPVVTDTPSVAPPLTSVRSLTSARTAVGMPSGAAGAVAAPAVQREVPITDARTAPLTSTASGTSGRDTAGPATAALGTRTILRSATGSRVRLGPPVSRPVDVPLMLAAPIGSGRAPTGPDAPLAGELRSHLAAPSPSITTSPHGATTADGDLGPAAPGSAGLGSAPNAWTYGGLEPAGLVLARVVATPGQSLFGAPDAPPASRQDTPTADGILVGSKPLSPTGRLPATSSGASEPGAARASAPTLGSGRTQATPSTTTSGTATGGHRSIQRSPAGDGAGSPAAGGITSGALRTAHTTTPPIPGSPIRRATTVAPGSPPNPRYVQRTAVATASHVRGTAAGVSEPQANRLRHMSSLARPTGASIATVQRDATASFDSLQSAQDVSHPAPTVPLQRDAGNAGNAGNASNAGNAGNVETAAAAVGEVSAMPERDLETIAHKLYPRLLRRLSSELLVARERAGMLADHH